MKFNKWTVALASAGVISLGSVAQAEERSEVLTSLSATTLSGYVDTSVIYPLPGREGSIAGRSFDGSRDKLGGFNLHAVQVKLEKPLDEGEWSAGYTADLIFGPDASYYSSLLDRQAIGGGADIDDFAVKQAYVALRAPVGNGLDIKLGVWDTLVGYEVFESGRNPNFSRSYGYYLEPTHHTGVLLSYHLNESISFSGGLANGWAGAINDKNYHSSHLTYLGSVTVILPEQAGIFAGSGIYAGIVHGEVADYIATGSMNQPEITSYYLGATVGTPIEGLAFGAALDYRDNGVGFLTRGTGVDGGGNTIYEALAADSNFAWAAAFYASFQATEKFRLNARADYTRASNGTYYEEGPTAAELGLPVGMTAPGGKNELGSLTLTGDYLAWANVLTRAEIRWDHAFSDGSPFLDGRRDAVTLAGNVVYKF